jgi:hypothetical protein
VFVGNVLLMSLAPSGDVAVRRIPGGVSKRIANVFHIELMCSSRQGSNRHVFNKSKFSNPEPVLIELLLSKSNPT